MRTKFQGRRDEGQEGISQDSIQGKTEPDLEGTVAPGCGLLWDKEEELWTWALWPQCTDPDSHSVQILLGAWSGKLPAASMAVLRAKFTSSMVGL